MIINSSKHGRTRRDTAKLAAHLYKSENDFVLLAEVGNTVAADLAGALRDMELLRDGAIPGAAAFHHFPLSPATDRTHAEILEAAQALRREFDPDGTRPYAVVIHGKERAGGADGRVHGHLVLGNFDSEGRAIKDRFTKVRTERLAREIEYSWRHEQPGAPSEPCGLGRHHVSVLRALRKSRREVAAWLANAHGEKPEKPKSAISSASRNRAKRHNFDLPAARAAVQKVWAETLEIGAFRTALASAGYEIAPGTKPGVWVLRDSKNGFVLGAVDRLLKLKRQGVRNMMETTDERKQQRETQPRLGAVDGRARPEAVRPGQGNRHGAGSVEAVARAHGGTGSRARQRSGAQDRRLADEHFNSTARTGAAPADPRPQTRFSYRTLDRKRAVRRLNRLDLSRIVALAALYTKRPPYDRELREEATFGPEVHLVDGKDIWGIPRARPRL
ncbi:hypothetical protein JQ612_02355 [Bradyrhizobium manausense]|uniref:hypothetical protein n=1 Tax=Bradyrhizobium manausense TaxID=989370 RepID=UPI001BAAB52E|nr:hypothetical protein [Bradyrhizobium manausense]MBR0832020.1 hypothetical protein [Bradyrhizobium manausense]